MWITKKCAKDEGKKKPQTAGEAIWGEGRPREGGQEG